MTVRSIRVLAILCLVALSTGACRTEESGTSSTTAPDTQTETTAAPTTSSTTSAVADTVVTKARSIEIVDEDGLSQPGETWNKLPESYFVWGVEENDVLNIRSGPGVDNGVVATADPNSGDLKIFDVIENVAASSWTPVEVTADGRIGWVTTRYLRPQAPPGAPTVVGSSTPAAAMIMADTLAVLDDPQALAQLVGSQGLTISPFATVTDETVTLSKERMANDSDIPYEWGFTTGKGDAIVSTLDEYLAGLAGRTALTSTAEIGYDVRIGGGNSIDNLDEVFPDATIVEYHHPGTSFYAGLDWTSVRFVFATDPQGSDPDALVLRGLISDQWEI